MDKKTILGIALIIVVTLLMPLYQKWIVGDQPVQKQAEMQTDTTRAITPADTVAEKKMTKPPVAAAEEKSEENQALPESAPEAPGANIEAAAETKTIEIENSLFRVVWSSQNGGNPVSWELKKYDSYHGGKVNLIDQNALNINFLNKDGKEIDLNDYNLYADYPAAGKIVLDKDHPETELKYYLPVDGGRIVKTVRLFNDKYAFDVNVEFENLQNYVINRRFFVSWQRGLPTTEENVKDDLRYTKAFTYMAEELEDIDAEDKYAEKDFNGRVDWVAVRTKYFLAAIIPQNPDFTEGSVIGGIKETHEDVEEEIYNITVETKYEPTADYSRNFTVYLGPLDYYVLKKYDVELQALVMNNGWYERLFRPISLLIIPAFKFLHRFIPNYGLVIIIFSILIKLVLHPLTKKSYQSMSEMQYLQPKMTELREQYKNDPQRMNKELMKLYKEHGVNPLGGCLPMLLQMPVLVALFTVFKSTIQLRGEPFVLWINDLSLPDVLHIGVNLPLVGDNIHVLPLLMAVTMIWQSKMTMTDPKQKMMIYFMPVFMAFVFYSLPSGLNLYYAVFNILSMVQTRQIKKKMHPDEEEEEVKVQPAKEKKPHKSNKGKKSKK